MGTIRPEAGITECAGAAATRRRFRYAGLLAAGLLVGFLAGCTTPTDAPAVPAKSTEALQDYHCLDALILGDSLRAKSWCQAPATADTAFARCLALVLRDDHENMTAACRTAADRGNAIAQGKLGHMYHSGHGAVEDIREAVRWYRLATEGGNAKAQFLLGTAYMYGEGIARDPVKAQALFSMAVERIGEQVPTLGLQRENQAKTLSPDQIVEARRLLADCRGRNYEGCGF